MIYIEHAINEMELYEIVFHELTDLKHVLESKKMQNNGQKKDARKVQ